MNLLPNMITLLRFVLIIPVIISLLSGYYVVGLLFFVIAGITDALDGYLARRFGWITRFGSIADPLADKMLLLSCFIALWYLTVLPFWLVFVIILRDFIIIGGATAYHFLVGPYDFVPSMLSKINTCMQILLVFVMLVQLSFSIFPFWLLNAIMWAVLLSTLASLLDYVWVWSLKALKLKETSHGTSK